MASIFSILKPYEKNLIDVLRCRAEIQPNDIAYTFLSDGEVEDGSVTYRELYSRVQAVAVYLRRNVRKGTRAILIYPPGIEFIVSFLGCLFSGIIAVPAYPPRLNRSLDRISLISKDCQAEVILSTTHLYNKLSESLDKLSPLSNLKWIITEKIDQELLCDGESFIIDNESVAFLQYSSGSTGDPKGIMISHSNIVANSKYIQIVHNLAVESVSITWLPSFHDMGLIDGIIQPLFTGFRGIIMPPACFLQQPIKWLKAISKYRATHSGGPNFGYELCVDRISNLDCLDLSSWKNAYVGAEPVHKLTLDRFVEKFGKCGFSKNNFHPCYGLAEGTLVVTGGEYNKSPEECYVDRQSVEKNKVVYLKEGDLGGKYYVGNGHSWFDTEVMIVDDRSKNKCLGDEIGEIWIAGPSVTKGYWKKDINNEVYDARLATGEGVFFRTGDLGFIKDGILYVTGRLKDLIIIRGQNYYPQDIEKVVENCHVAIRKDCAAAFSVEVGSEEKLIVIAEVERTYLKKVNDEMARLIRQSIWQETQLQPHEIFLIKTGSIPKTSSGKIQRYECKKRYLADKLDFVHRNEIPKLK